MREEKFSKKIDEIQKNDNIDTNLKIIKNENKT